MLSVSEPRSEGGGRFWQLASPKVGDHEKGCQVSYRAGRRLEHRQRVDSCGFENSMAGEIKE